MPQLQKSGGGGKIHGRTARRLQAPPSNVAQLSKRTGQGPLCTMIERGKNFFLLKNTIVHVSIHGMPNPPPPPHPRDQKGPEKF